MGFGGARWIAKGSAMIAHGLKRSLRVGVEKRACECIRMQRCETVSFQIRTGKVPEILRNDDIGFAFYRCRKDMAVMLVLKCEIPDKVFKSCNRRVGKMFVHDVSNPLKGISRQIRPVSNQISNPFFVYNGAPLRFIKSSGRESQQNVTHGGRIKDVRVQECGGHFLLQTKVLVLRGQGIEGLPPRPLASSAIYQQVFDGNPAVRPDQSVRNFALIQKLDQMGS